MYDFVGNYERQLEDVKNQSRICLDEIERIKDELDKLRTHSGSDVPSRLESLEKLLFQKVRLAYMCAREIEFLRPAGCIFALLPTQDDGRLRWYQMKKVDFKRNPSVLFAILTTPENVPRVKEWCRASGIDSDKVCDFHAFLNWNIDVERRLVK